MVLNTRRTLLSETFDLRFTPPTEAFQGELALPGERRARLLTFGSGHTESDAVLFLAQDRVLFAGDLVVVGRPPNLCSGNPERWLEVLGRLEALRPERIVPGHGPMGTAGALDEMREYLSTLLSLAEEGKEAAVPLRFRARDSGDSGQFSENMKFLRTRATTKRSGTGG